MILSCDITLATHCGAVLLHQKPAALFSVPPGQCLYMRSQLAEIAPGLRWIVLRASRNAALVMVYSEALLGRALAQPAAQDILGPLGYPAGTDVSSALAHLRHRLWLTPDFPHEIGFFLGYPPRDVIGFITHRGSNYKYAGLWKVYDNVAYAKTLFERYRRCSEVLLAYINDHGRLSDPGALKAALPLAMHRGS